MARMLALLLVPILWHSALVIAQPTSVILEQRRFEVVNGDSCIAEIVESHRETGEPNERVRIRCQNKTIFTHDLRNAGIQNMALYTGPNYAGPIRIAINWERGTGAGLTILEIHSSPTRTIASIAFESFSKIGAEVFENGDVVLANVGHRFLENEIVPEGTNLYRWKESKYQFERGFLWQKDAKWIDRYCILLKAEACPANQVTTPVPNN
jgi:hypothetical protein